MKFTCSLAIASSLALAAQTKTVEEWKKRSVYQLLTDRYNFKGASAACLDLHNYCGGTFSGITEKLDYI
jgi:alpha-amylase